MAKHLLIITIVGLMMGGVRAQSWTIRCKDITPFEYTEFEDGFVDDNGVTFLAGSNGQNQEDCMAFVMRIEPDGASSTYRYEGNGCISSFSSIVKMSNGNLFAAGNLRDASDDYIFTMTLSDDLTELNTRQYFKEIEGLRFGRCTAMADEDGHVIVASSVIRGQSIWTEAKGLLLKYDHNNVPIHQRYLIADYPDPIYFMNRFNVRQMWYNHEEDTFRCLVPGSDGVYSFIIFDSDFNILNETFIQDESCDIIGHTLSDDCYCDLWTSNSEAILFSSLGWIDHNKLRVMKINAEGEFLDFIHLNERVDTIDNVAPYHCMAAPDDTTLYFSTYYSPWPAYPGRANIYLLNERLEIIANHLIEGQESMRASLILATPDGGCISINDSCSYQAFDEDRYPIITKLTRDDFLFLPWTIQETNLNTLQTSTQAYPNPTSGPLSIPLTNNGTARCRISDSYGTILLDCKIPPNDCTLHLNVDALKTGIYYYIIYNNTNIALKGTFIKI